MHVIFVVTARCNAACAHCSTSCGPQRHESLPRGKLLELMDEAAALAGPEGKPELHFSISGGEPFLDFELLEEAIAHGSLVGAGTSCVTNGYWASSDQKARRLLTRLRDAGLGILAVSTSRFHQNFVKRSRVERALRIGNELGLTCHLKFVRTVSDPEDDAAIEAWARSAGAGIVQIIPLLPALRQGATVPEHEYLRPEALPDEPCPAPVVSVLESGATYGCCTPGAFIPFFSLGNVHQASLADVRARFRLGGKQQILRAQGPGYFVREIRRRGHGGRLRAAYSGVCELCTHIGQDPILSGIAEECAAALEMRQLEKMLDQVVEGARGPTRDDLLAYYQGVSK